MSLQFTPPPEKCFQKPVSLPSRCARGCCSPSFPTPPPPPHLRSSCTFTNLYPPTPPTLHTFCSSSAWKPSAWPTARANSSESATACLWRLPNAAQSSPTGGGGEEQGCECSECNKCGVLLPRPACGDSRMPPSPRLQEGRGEENKGVKSMFKIKSWMACCYGLWTGEGWRFAPASPACPCPPPPYTSSPH